MVDADVLASIENHISGKWHTKKNPKKSFVFKPETQYFRNVHFKVLSPATRSRGARYLKERYVFIQRNCHYGRSPHSVR